ncbi:MAG: hypothetical protein H0U42_08685 [Thermoleophilaceae bacterium]|nr:hypothetical protein [Thermoleophilaceae bacterium]
MTETKPHRILALVSEPVSGEQLRSAIGESAANAEVLVVAPALISRTRWIFADPDPAIDRAEAVQEETVHQLDEDGVDAAGNTGESDPLLAIQDALATWPADELVVFHHPEAEANWLEDGLVDDARARFSLPIKEFTVE